MKQYSFTSAVNTDGAARQDLIKVLEVKRRTKRSHCPHVAYILLGDTDKTGTSGIKISTVCSLKFQLNIWIVRVISLPSLFSSLRDCELGRGQSHR